MGLPIELMHDSGYVAMERRPPTHLLVHVTDGGAGLFCEKEMRLWPHGEPIVIAIHVSPHDTHVAITFRLCE